MGTIASHRSSNRGWARLRLAQSSRAKLHVQRRKEKERLRERHIRYRRDQRPTPLESWRREATLSVVALTIVVALWFVRRSS